MMNENRPRKMKMQDCSELEKFIKFFALKTIQAVVQSRLGEKKKSKSKANGSTYDWFNVSIEDNTEIQEYAKKSITGQTFLMNFSMCIEILLKTADGDNLVLETWCLCMNEYSEPNIKVSSVYCRMTLLLKSIIAVARVTPAYKLSGRQSSDSYVVMYRVYFGPPQVHQLGEGYQESKIGEVVTPIGILVMSVAYRTKMTITPQKVEKESPFMVKSDYFKPDMSPKRTRPIGMHGFHLERNTSAEENRRPIPEGFSTNNSFNPIVNGFHDKHQFNSSDNNKDWSCDLVNGDSKRNSLNRQISPGDGPIAGAFAPSTKFPDSTLFSDLLPDTPLLHFVSNKMKNLDEKRLHPEHSRNADKNANLNINMVDYKKEIPNEVDYNCNANDPNDQKLNGSGNSDCGDFVMVELRPPFVDSASNNDLGAFFQECQNAPPLACFATQPTIEEQVTDIASQLAQYELSMPDIDSFVNAFCQIDTQK